MGSPLPRCPENFKESETLSLLLAPSVKGVFEARRHGDVEM